MQTKLSEVLAYTQRCQINLTSQQQLILQVICDESEPLAAHVILARLKLYNPRANRMTIHRGLEYLMQHNLVHKISFDNTYTLCDHLEQVCCQILVCKNCGSKQELHSHTIQQELEQLVVNYGFKLAKPIELTGYCVTCSG